MKLICDRKCCRWIGAIVLLMPIVAAQASDLLPLSVSAKTLDATSPSSPSPMPQMARNEPPPATLPSERLPQYQFGYKHSDELSTMTDGRVRFLLVPPGLEASTGPVQVQITVKIDGEPFSIARQKVAKQLSEGSANPVAQREADDVENVEDESTDADVLQASTASYQLTTDAQEFARRYAAATGEPLETEEASWLLTHWAEGPSLLLLQPYFQQFRADERPAFRVLDRDRDGVISAAEIKAASVNLEKCDADRNEVVDVLEISDAAKKAMDATERTQTKAPLIILVQNLSKTLESHPFLRESLITIDQNGDGQFQQDEIERLRDVRADIELEIEFSTEDPDESKLTLISHSGRLDLKESTPGAKSVQLSLDANVIEFAAVQRSSSQQISLGAVMDGYPLLPSLDPNDDGRLTIRERRELPSRLGRFDLDGDGALTAPEVLPPIRVCVGLGPTAHLELAKIRTTSNIVSEKSIEGPDWFVRMDRNADNDLSRSEFPGTDDQFTNLDSDDDQLISAAEAIEFENQATSSDK
ncbi:MAG: hypothetical protein AAGI63_16590 [Planctomycetota bacterium]